MGVGADVDVVGDNDVNEDGKARKMRKGAPTLVDAKKASQTNSTETRMTKSGHREGERVESVDNQSVAAAGCVASRADASCLRLNCVDCCAVARWMDGLID